MNDQTLQDLRERMEAIRKNRDRLLTELEATNTQLESFQSVFQDMLETHAREKQEERDSIPAKFMRNQIVEILKDEGEPLANAEVYRRLMQREVPVNGQDPVKNVGSHLSLDDRFERYGPGLWGLASWRKNPPRKRKEGSRNDDSLPEYPSRSVSSEGRLQDETRKHIIELMADRRVQGA